MRLCENCGNAIIRPNLDGLTHVLCPVCERQHKRHYRELAERMAATSEAMKEQQNKQFPAIP